MEKLGEKALKKLTVGEKLADGMETHYEYDAAGNLIHWKNATGRESWHEYDEKGNEIRWKCGNGDKTFY